MSKNQRILVVGEVEKGIAIAGAPLLAEAGGIGLHPSVEWLFFYRDNMGIITEQYGGKKLITGYPILGFDTQGTPFEDTVSKQLYTAFFKRFVYAKGARIIVSTTTIAQRLTYKIARKNDIRSVFYVGEGQSLSQQDIREIKKLDVYTAGKTMLHNTTLPHILQASSFTTLLENFVNEVHEGTGEKTSAGDKAPGL